MIKMLKSIAKEAGKAHRNSANDDEYWMGYRDAMYDLARHLEGEQQHSKPMSDGIANAKDAS